MSTNQQVDRFNDIEKNFVFAVFDAFQPPGDSVCDCGRRPRCYFQLLALLGNILLENFTVCELRIPKVHNLIQKFIHNDEVVTDTLFFELFEVLLEYLREKFAFYCGVLSLVLKAKWVDKEIQTFSSLLMSHNIPLEGRNSTNLQAIISTKRMMFQKPGWQQN